MKRRQAIQSLLGIPAAAVVAQSQIDKPVPTPSDELPKTAVAGGEIVGPGTTRFFTAQQLAALRRLAEIISPATDTVPGATQAGAAEFLDFLIGSSPQDRATLYRSGLDRLNAEAHKQHHEAFAELTAEQADAILSPLRDPWTYNQPSDPFAEFLLAAKQDIMTATVNSREWVQAASARRRSAGGMGLYWFPIE